MPVERKGSSRCSFLQLQEGFFFFCFFCFFGQRASITDYAADGEFREDGMGRDGMESTDERFGEGV